MNFQKYSAGKFLSSYSYMHIRISILVILSLVGGNKIKNLRLFVVNETFYRKNTIGRY